MAFMFHHIWDVIHQPLTNSYFSRWLKPPVFVFIHRVCTIIVLLYTIVHYCTLYIHCTYTVHTVHPYLCGSKLGMFMVVGYVLCVLVWKAGMPLFIHCLLIIYPVKLAMYVVKSQCLMVQSPLKTAFNWWFPELFHPNIIPSILFLLFSGKWIWWLFI